MANPKPKALYIYIVAEQFRSAAILSDYIPHIAARMPVLRQAIEGVGLSLPTLYLPTAYMVCRALSLELYFKCLMRIVGKQFGREHDLEKLFHLLSKRTQKKIKTYWQEGSARVVSDVENNYANSGRPVPKVDFDFVLKVSKGAFTQLRYIYEGVGQDTGWLGDQIADSARRVILEMRPGWITMVQKFPDHSISHTHPPHS